MAKTIIQTIGPLYGEVVNGTVFGRPNGSVFVPNSNTIEMSVIEDYRYIFKANAQDWRICNSAGVATVGKGVDCVAESQDIASNITLEIFTDSECTDRVASRNIPAGQFNFAGLRDIQSSKTVEDGTTYYLRAQLVNNNSPVATSTIIPIVGVANE